MECDSTPSTETSVNNDDSFADLVKREVIRKLQHFEQEKRQRLVLKKYIPTFSEEIRCMMYTHGDVREPLSESVLFMGTVLRDQMNMLLVKATEAGPKQMNNALTHEHLLSLLLKNKRKLKRLLYYLKMKDVKECLFKKVQPIADLIDGVEHGKKVTACLEFLLKIDENFDKASMMDNSVTDPVVVKRQQRRYVTTYYMNEAEYFEFSKKLQASFYPKNGGKLFSQWLLIDNVTRLVPTELALEIINFLAYETVAEIMDLCLYLKYNRNIDKPEKETNAVIKDKPVDRDSTDCPSSSLKSGAISLPQKEGCDAIPKHKDKPYVNKGFMGPLDDPIMPNYDHQNIINSNLDINLMSETFGNEFKKGIVKKPITPANIREAVNLVSGIYEYEYNVHWKRAKRPSLLCIQDNDTILLQKYS